MLDRIGITATSLCALHCILLPVLLPALPLLGLSFLADHAWEHVFLLMTAALGTLALFSGFKKYHRKYYPFYLLFLGVGIYWIKHDFSEDIQPFFILIGASLIVAAHVINLKLCNSCKQCISDTCESS
ncbi:MULTISPECIES: MerC domain-containing protein [unclassified Colwellia]|uniref:MerC domain-containing protein n=1 Tax=unclassified Colwellia TaxID=196834 RepID=UPI0015F72D93|nr:MULTISPECIES: MerC domain-containing protein [unclassified Colwellia]MBA6337882.1 MerC domain-containing protein [Colwellia sp. BRX8-7]MBA6380236.1 MerC domain-containing protein [Colwellia sp. BRX10-7]MBA6387458.1 MerC domain-containing protein [Colwellia sp. BRX10-2]MBA6402535.1 MerC domain-containing protein [Colwellia sp. BRX10-5]MBA6406680.1 MerC domain-containing protein [Colwellia sp. BRX10-1]